MVACACRWCSTVPERLAEDRVSRMTPAVQSYVHLARAHRASALVLALCLGAAACLDDSPVAPANGPVQLEIRAQVAPGPGERAVAIHVYYLRQNEDRVDLPATPAQVNVPRGGTATRAVTVEIAECLADPLRMTGESGTGCRFFIELRLLDEDGEFISEQTHEAEASAPGQQVPVEPFNLPQASVGASSSAVSFAATEHDEGRPAAKTINVFSSTGAELGELSSEVMYPDEGELPAWLDVSLDGGILTLRPSTTSLFPRTYTATVRVSASRADVAVKDILVTYVVAGLPRRLVVSGDGQGAATVVSSPEGIDCLLIFGRTNAGCVEDFPFGTVVTLSITADEGSFFEGWSGACSGSGACVVTMDQDQSVVAQFGEPSPGGDLVIFSDVNLFDATGLQTTSNVQLVDNLVDYTTTRGRSSARTVQLECGRGSGQAELLCGSFFDEFSRRLAQIDYSSVITSSKQGSLTSVPANVKVIAFLLSCEVFTASEVNVLKKFAEEGGRIVFVSENSAAFPAACGIVQDRLAADLGINMTHVNAQIECGQHRAIPGSSLRPHQITEGVTELMIACSSEIDVGFGAYPLFFDRLGTRVLAAVGKVDTSPISVVTFKAENESLVLPGSRAIRTGLRALIGH